MKTNGLRDLILMVVVFFASRLLAQEYLSDLVYNYFRNGGM